MVWQKNNTLSEQNPQEFHWYIDDKGNIHIKSNHTSQFFSSEDYAAAITHIRTNPEGVPLGARRDGNVPQNSLGALMEGRRGQSIRGWCSHLAVIAFHRGDISYEDRGRGPGRGLWLFPLKKAS